MVRPKPPEPHHIFNLRLPVSVFTRLAWRSRRDGHSINTQIRLFVEAGLLDSPITHTEPAEVLPWLDEDH
jgi:hypothetical protein